MHKGVKKNSANVHEKTLKDMSLYMQLACNFSLQFFFIFFNRLISVLVYKASSSSIPLGVGLDPVLHHC